MATTTQTTMRRTKDGNAWVYRGHRIENLQHRHTVGTAAWAITRRGVRLANGLSSRKDACDFVNALLAAAL